MIIVCLRSTIASGGIDFPIFVGFAQAEALDKIAEAPSFPRGAANEALARALINPPVHDWQRPQDDDRIDAIRRFFGSGSGEIMPNPVLLAASPAFQGQVTATRISNSQELYEVDIPPAPQRQADPRPLWILDGQHRIRGLAKSTQRQNDLPVVLLLDHLTGAQPAYNGNKFAALFAQVTTTATNLDEVHRDWLSYSYELKPYTPNQPNTADYQEAMETVIELCSSATIPRARRSANPWYNRICFNPEWRARNKHTPFYFECHELREVIRKQYFSRRPTGRLTPKELARELMLARSALEAVLGASKSRSVFYGTRGQGQRAMQDGFIHACLARLFQTGTGTDWTELLRRLRFDKTNWTFGWADTSGTLGTYSKRVAARGLSKLFEDGALPPGAPTPAEYMKGRAAAVEIEIHQMGARGQRRRHGAGQQNHVIAPGRVNALTAPSPNHVVRLNDAWKKRGNVAHIEVETITSASGQAIQAKDLLGSRSAPGVRLKALGQSGSLDVQLVLHHYGGMKSPLPFSVRW